MYMSIVDGAAATAQTRHAHILVEPGDYERFGRIARQTRTSVAEPIRRAVRERYLQRALPGDDPAARMACLQLDLPAWDELARELDEAYDGGLR